ncbi:sister chromatid cohesion protein 1 [Cladophialophora chaetospira]|uniref:Sister chromatid cohesion protein 1 n=1 Tax=Cladophialophora chaetospira TaxID=386627 RepID=A0AA38X1Z6_9EURO|nr:sister chromatid cohesion protein 1 [Cladophialophora chaetospira]
MFYSEQLLAKTGPLARVWLAANVERKLSKSQILQSDIESSVGAIVDRGHEPMALRLSGQLMLGVVRIYGRKARYLLDDCNEALIKIRMTFKSTNNHDLPAHATTTIDLNLPELLTIDDLFSNMDFTFPMTQQPAITDGQSEDLDEDWTSSLNPQKTSTQSLLTPDDEPLYDDDGLNLDFNGGDMDMNDTTVSINVGRNASTPRGAADDIFGEEGLLHDDEDGLNLDFDQDVPMLDQPDIQTADDTLPAGGDDEPLAFGDDETLQLQQAAQRQRDTESPLSEADPDLIRELDQTFQNPGEEEEIEEVAVQQRQRSRKQRPIAPDVETVLHNKQIKAQAEDRSKILRPPSFLPRDPLLLTLMNMQKNGDFVTNAINDGRSMNWAPELQGLLSFETVMRPGDRKRKRDSGVGGLSEDEHSEKSPRLEGPDDVLEDEAIQLEDAQRLTPTADDSLPQPMSEGGPALEDMVHGEDDEGIFGGDDTFDDTTMPILHPSESGAVSLGTKHAVHLLRDRLGDAAGAQPSSPAKKSILLQEIVPEGRTSKEDATKMFFEVLVLATKDAIKVDQSDKAIGMPIRIRGRRGLWGSWAETSPGDDPTANNASQQVAAAA